MDLDRLAAEIAVEVTTTAASPRLAASCPTVTGTPASTRCRV